MTVYKDYNKYLAERLKGITQKDPWSLALYRGSHWEFILPFLPDPWHFFADDIHTEAEIEDTLKETAKKVREGLTLPQGIELVTSHVWCILDEAARNTYFLCGKPGHANGLHLKEGFSQNHLALWHRIFLELYYSMLGRDVTLNNRLREHLEAQGGSSPWCQVSFWIVRDEDGACIFRLKPATDSD